MVSALGRWPCRISLFICLPGLSPALSAPFRWPCSISIHLPPRSVTGVRPFALPMQHFYSSVSQVCHWWCPPFSVGHVAFLFICLPGLSLPVSAGHAAFLSPRSVTAGVRPCPLAMLHFYSCAPQDCHWWCPRPCSISILLSPRSVTGVSLSFGHEAFLFICLPGPSLLVPCSISIHLSFRSVTGGVRPFPLGMQHFYSFVSRVCHWCCPFPLFLFICLPCLSLLISALFRWPCSVSIHLSRRPHVQPVSMPMEFLSRSLPTACPPCSTHRSCQDKLGTDGMRSFGGDPDGFLAACLLAFSRPAKLAGSLDGGHAVRLQRS